MSGKQKDGLSEEACVDEYESVALLDNRIILEVSSSSTMASETIFAAAADGSLTNKRFRAAYQQQHNSQTSAHLIAWGAIIEKAGTYAAGVLLGLVQPVHYTGPVLIAEIVRTVQLTGVQCIALPCCFIQG